MNTTETKNERHHERHRNTPETKNETSEMNDIVNTPETKNETMGRRNHVSGKDKGGPSTGGFLNDRLFS